MFSYSLARIARGQIERIKLTAAELGIRFALQLERTLSRLHSFFPNERFESDYLKAGVFARPTSDSLKKVLYHIGLTIDHASGVIAGFVITPIPTTASGLRLALASIAPPAIWLPHHLAERYGADFDIAGIPRLWAIDNAKDLISDAMTEMLALLGSIILLMPPKRGDLKGKSERTNQTFRRRYLQNLKGYIPTKYKFTDPRYQRLRKAAEAEANLTYDELEKTVLLACIHFNHQPHPDLKRPRMEIYRQGLKSAPPVLLAGRTQLDLTFALSFPSHITNEGVAAATWVYQSDELRSLNLVERVPVTIRIPVNDVRTAYVLVPSLVEPIRVELQTHRFRDPTPYELALALIGSGPGTEVREEFASMDPKTAADFMSRFHTLQTTDEPLKGTKAHVNTTARSQSRRAPPVDPPSPSGPSSDDIRKMFGDAQEDDES